MAVAVPAKCAKMAKDSRRHWMMRPDVTNLRVGHKPQPTGARRWTQTQKPRSTIEEDDAARASSSTPKQIKMQGAIAKASPLAAHRDGACAHACGAHRCKRERCSCVTLHEMRCSQFAQMLLLLLRRPMRRGCAGLRLEVIQPVEDSGALPTSRDAATIKVTSKCSGSCACAVLSSVTAAHSRQSHVL